MGQTVLRLVQSDETIRLMFDRRPQQEKNNDADIPHLKQGPKKKEGADN